MPHPSFKKLAHSLPFQSHLWLFWFDFRGSRELYTVLWSFAIICESYRRAERRGGRTQVFCRALVCTVVQRDPRANRAATLPATQPSSRPDFPNAGTGLLAPPTLLSHSRSWQDLCELALAPDVDCGVGRPLPDGHLVVKLASCLHHFYIIPSATELWWKERASVGCAEAFLYVICGSVKLCCSSHTFER